MCIYLDVGHIRTLALCLHTDAIVDDAHSFYDYQVDLWEYL